MAALVILPADHPQRPMLADEVHSRPPTEVQSPAAIASLALIGAAPARSLAALAALARLFGQEGLPAADAPHIVLELPGLRVKWERHGEFVSFTFVRPLPELEIGSLGSLTAFPSAFEALPTDWLANLPGHTIAATDILLVKFGTQAPDSGAIARWFDGHSLAGGNVLDARAWLFTDFVLKDTGRTQWLALDVGLDQAQTSRLAQRLIEIEIYRMTALLGFPLARAALPELNRIERELERITSAIAAVQEANAASAVQSDERRLLDELSRVAAEVERSVAASAFRFSAAAAYWDLVLARVSELRERRFGDMRTLGGFLSRRMGPAMNSCAAAARRQEEISARIERASSLLRTRVDIAREEQNQRMLASMERRAKQQLRLQQTVETLSVAAVTYYTVGLVGYLAKPLISVWPQLNPDWVTAAAIPLVAYVVWRSMRRIRQKISDD